MSDQNSNAQVQPPTPPTSTGPSLEDLQAKVAELERAKEGLIKDAQHERQKRQELEQRLQAPTPAASSTVTPDVNPELEQLIAPVVQKHVTSYAEQVRQLQAQIERERAYQTVASKAGKRVEEIQADRALQDRLVAIANKWGLAGSAPEVAAKAYELMQLEDERQRAADAARNAAAASQQPLTGGAAPTPSSQSRVLSNAEFQAMSVSEFDRLSLNGSFKKQPDGSFVYAPRS